ncbi:Dioxygenase [Ceratobasidium theobromae]|uniref:Dioxygenase n=1 Tax=Ceratobasidium theobromae TaxID=1582974 RepID=A0A5N5QV73_9AGAM|nr:Dioxygenase [Ceratobasidium theobromae]
MKFSISTVVAIISMGLLVQAHPGDHDDFDMLPASELAARELAADRRAELVRNCGPQIAAYEAERRAKRSALMKRQATSTSTAASAKYTTIQNTTCVTAPEVTEGPYYINNEYYRTDLRETQAGVKLILDIGIMDTRTCTPLPNALVELWHCNSTGAYGGFTTSSSLSDKFTWLRGGSETNANGALTKHMLTVDYYLPWILQVSHFGIMGTALELTELIVSDTGRTIHIHTMIHTSWSKSANGTIVSKAGSLRHIGQLFFQESLNDQVVALSPYTSTRQSRTLNAQDGIYAQQNSRGFNGVVAVALSVAEYDRTDYMHLVPVSSGYTTIGVDGQASYSITSNNYLTP